MKFCDTCEKELSFECFGRSRSRKDGLHPTCKQCKKISDKKYWDKNRDKLLLKKQQYYLENKNHIVEKTKLYAKLNREQHNLWSYSSRRNLKTEVFSHYCSGDIQCKGCGLADFDLLTMDHVAGGGNKHRKEVGIKTGYQTYLWLKRNDYPDGFQALCWNCQYRKRKQEIAPKNPTPRQTQVTAYNRLIKVECLAHYGGICNCGENDIVVLTLDHINDDGAEHRRQLGKRGFNFYLYLRQNSFPNDPPLGVLCLNCQYRKRIENERKRKNRPTGIDQDSALIV